jgi:hypothetical protein
MRHALQGFGPQSPVPSERLAEASIIALPELAGLHHDYRRVAG